jgi:hypothetical protein
LQVSRRFSPMLVILAIVMIQYNSNHGTNNMIHSMYPIESIKNMKLFKKDLREIITRENIDLNMMNTKKVN